jgi:hypothetical protein
MTIQVSFRRTQVNEYFPSLFLQVTPGIVALAPTTPVKYFRRY